MKGAGIRITNSANIIKYRCFDEMESYDFNHWLLININYFV